MKTNRFFTVMTLTGLVAFTSCSVNDEIETYDGAVRFTAGIEQVATPQTQVGSRAAGTQWGSDAIGIFMVADGTTNLVENAINRRYTTTGDGNFTPDAGEDIYYPMDNSVVDFIAYYPYNSANTTLSNINVAIQTTQTAANQPDFDLLYSKDGTGKKSDGANPVTLTFDHMLAKIVMNIVQPSSLSSNNTGLTDNDLAGMTVTIKGMNTVNTFNLSNGTLGTAITPVDITPRMIPNSDSYDAIIMPAAATAALGDFSVDFIINPTTNPETFTWKMPAGTNFVGGNEYTYDVTLSRTGVTATGTINAWTGNPRPPVTAE